jgi:hypothetical protein
VGKLGYYKSKKINDMKKKINNNHPNSFYGINFKQHFINKIIVCFFGFILMSSSITIFAQTKVFQGNSYTVLARIDGDKVFQGNSYTVLARIDGNKIYQGNTYTVLARIEGNKIYQGNTYTLLARIEGDKIFQGNTYTTFARIDGDKIFQGNSYTVLARIDGILTTTQLAAILLFL